MLLKYRINRLLGITPKTQQEKNSSLIIAAYYGHAKMVDLLLNAGAEMNLASRVHILNCHAKTPLNIAANRGHIKIVNTLLEKGANPNESYNPPLIGAARKGYTEIVNALLEKGADPTDRALREAATMGHIEIVKTLLEKGANPDLALMKTTNNGNTKMVAVLLEGKASAEIFDNEGFAPLHIAASRGNTEMVNALLDGGANIDNITEKFDENKYADQRYNDQGRLHETALHVATRRGRTETVKTLLSRGANLNIKNRSGEMARDIATRMGHTEIIDVLDSYSKVKKNAPMSNTRDQQSKRTQNQLPKIPNEKLGSDEHIQQGQATSAFVNPYSAYLAPTDNQPSSSKSNRRSAQDGVSSSSKKSAEEIREIRRNRIRNGLRK